jgi:hypothetical protein
MEASGVNVDVQQKSGFLELVIFGVEGGGGV